ncbi:replication-relaxation family protein [Cytobacillus horneckiae]|uniref:Replication-relaxation n=1 Tax=Cytobacillus horneckiae TaxID=549687 RepID=A0A2N0ZB36_9BACI|nr:replication-relaxation family protein [Cytobacillus horneckiae]MEC1158693.1 replication-relaxation family protein [Cytobacillus horneckiae]NRG46651.1 replication-relaxation family protein [Bacillus sp. CRN 9]PKG26695.1 hypothetical protein CWS20_22880 [Cytobacillus horneckiae]
MRRHSYGGNVAEVDLMILNDLYNYRALKTDQISRKFFPHSKYYVNRVLNRLRTRKLIKSSILSGSRNHGKKGFSYHRLTETGLECLIRHGVSVEGQVQQHYVHPALLHYLLLVNDIMIDLSIGGWETWDSRKVKKEYNLDRNMLLHGLVINPNGKRFGLYIMEEGVTKNTLGKIQAEIRVHHHVLENYIVFAKGSNSYNSFIQFAINPPKKRINNQYIEQKQLYTGEALKVIPFDLGRQLYQAYPTENEWFMALAKHFNFEILNTQLDERQSFNILVKYKGEEMYFVDLTDTDLTKARAINSYSEHRFNLENRRKILVATFLKTQYDLIQSRYSYIEELLITKKDFNALLNKNQK